MDVSYAFNHNFNKSGFIVDANTFIGGYDYTVIANNLALGFLGVFQGSMISAGYHYVTKNYSAFNLLIGEEVLNSQLADPSLNCKGTNYNSLNNATGNACQASSAEILNNQQLKTTNYGYAITADAYLPVTDKAYIYASGLYTAIWQNYNIVGKIGYWATTSLAVGPQLNALSFSVIRGNLVKGIAPSVFANYYVTPLLSIVASGGYYIDISPQNILPNNGLAGSISLAYKY